MDPVTQQKIDRVKVLMAQFNSAVIDLYNDKGGSDILIEVDVVRMQQIGRLYDRPLLRVKLSEVKTL